MEKYIERCIFSVINLPLQKEEYEVIVINDGSTDSGMKIVETIAAGNNHLILINKENGGQSSARNIGIDAARGNYLFFLDSDDYVDGTTLNSALEYAIENDLDMLPVSSHIVYENGNMYPIDFYDEIKSPISGAEFLNNFFVGDYMWQYFYKSKIIKDNNLRLTENLHSSEDAEFIVRFLTFVNRLSYNQLSVYYYFQRQDSISNQREMKHRKSKIEDMIAVADCYGELIRQRSSDAYLIKGIENKRQGMLFSIFNQMHRDRFDKSDFADILGKLKQKGYYPLKVNQLSYKKRLIGHLLNQSVFLKILINIPTKHSDSLGRLFSISESKSIAKINRHK
jgi:Glycosyltransferases involved in cell wall biogenesis